MKYSNINIKSTGVYIPSHRVKNEEIIEHFAKQDRKVEGLLKAMDKEVRYFCENGETSLSMGHEASLMALDNAEINRNDIDMIIFISAQPEYLNPTTAMELRGLLKAHNAHVVFDMNDTCLGGISAVNVACRYMMSSDDVKNALIVSAQNISPVVDKNDTVAYSLMGDCGAALILSKEEENTKRGFINNVNYCRGAYVSHIKFPKCGLSKALSNDNVPFNINERNFTWDSFDIEWMGRDFGHTIGQLLIKCKIKNDDIDLCFMSQFSKRSVEEGLTLEGIPLEKNIYIGDKYGYTGPTSPILALHWGIQKKLIKKGGNIILGSVGTGIDYSMALFKF
jgi:3-oxoacyl-[acyl-carrier-protein] synthase III